jgi:hypothetical protein
MSLPGYLYSQRYDRTYALRGEDPFLAYERRAEQEERHRIADPARRPATAHLIIKAQLVLLTSENEKIISHQTCRRISINSGLAL